MSTEHLPSKSTIKKVTAQSWGTQNLVLMTPLWVAMTIVAYIFTQHFLDPKSAGYVHALGFFVAVALPIVLLYTLSVRAWSELKSELGGFFDVERDKRAKGNRFILTDMVGGAFLTAASASLGYFALVVLQNFWPGEPASGVVVPEPNMLAYGALAVWLVLAHRLFIQRTLPKPPVTVVSGVNSEGKVMTNFVHESP